MADWIVRETDLWSLRCYNAGYVYIKQKASGETRTCLRMYLPSADKVDEMSDYRFNKLCREVFHGEV